MNKDILQNIAIAASLVGGVISIYGLIAMVDILFFVGILVSTASGLYAIYSSDEGGIYD